MWHAHKVKFCMFAIFSYSNIDLVNGTYFSLDFGILWMFYYIKHYIRILVTFFLFQVRPGEPVYAQVNRDKKKNSRNHSENPQMMMHYSDYSEHADHWQQPTPQPQHIHGPAATPAGDSWVWSKCYECFLCMIFASYNKPVQNFFQAQKNRFYSCKNHF